MLRHTWRACAPTDQRTHKPRHQAPPASSCLIPTSKHSMTCFALQASYEPENVPAFSAASGKVTDWKGDLLALGLFEEDFKAPDDTSDGEKGGGEGVTAVESAAFKAIDEQLAGGALAEAAAVAEFNGKKVCVLFNIDTSL